MREWPNRSTRLDKGLKASIPDVPRMMKGNTMRNYLNSVSSSPITFAAAAEAGSDTPEKAEKGQAAVYLKGEDTLQAVVLHCENAASANLSFCAAMTVHLIARCYTPILRDRVKPEDVKTEILNAVREHGNAKRGKEFGRAWSYRILSLALRMGRSLMTDYDKKGVQDGSPLSQVLRARSADKGIEIVTQFMTQKTKGQNNLQTLEKALEPPKQTNAKAKGRKGQGKDKQSNNAAKDTKVASQTLNDAKTAVVAIQNVKAKSGKDRAEKLADRIGAANNVDHKAFVLKSLQFLKAEELIEVSQACLDLAKAMNEAETGEETPRKMEAAG